ncbi:unnamed protein product [Urochloa humidicola]
MLTGAGGVEVERPAGRRCMLAPRPPHARRHRCTLTRTAPRPPHTCSRRCTKTLPVAAAHRLRNRRMVNTAGRCRTPPCLPPPHKVRCAACRLQIGKKFPRKC